MWWINKNGNIEGPFSSEQIEKRIKLNMLRSLDRISIDKVKWQYVKDTELWNPTRTIQDPPPPLTSRMRRKASSEPHVEEVHNGSAAEHSAPSPVIGPVRVVPPQVVGPVRVAPPKGFSRKASAAKKSADSGVWIAIVIIIIIIILGALNK